MNMIQARAANVIGYRNSKMPGTTYAVHPDHCRTGAKLHPVPGTTCSICYALKIALRYPSANDGWNANHARWIQAAESPAGIHLWIESSVYQIHHYVGRTYQIDKQPKLIAPDHRWFDAGDLQGPMHFQAICDVAAATPDINHWMSTNEPGFLGSTAIPGNLTVRVSGIKIDGRRRQFPRRPGLNTSTVHKALPPIGHACAAHANNNQCGNCRVCWDRSKQNVSYPAH